MKVRKGDSEEIPLVQGKEQWLHFAGAAVKRYPMAEVRGGGREELLPASVGPNLTILVFLAII